MQRPSSRSASSSRRPSSSHGAEGQYEPVTAPPPDAYDLCNAFWVDGHSSRAHGGRDPDDPELDWGREGFETVLGRVRSAQRVCDDLRALLKER